jgi:hypothetical protein
MFSILCIEFQHESEVIDEEDKNYEGKKRLKSNDADRLYIYFLLNYN